MPIWRKRTKGTPNQIGKSFVLTESSQQEQKGRLAKIRGGMSGLQFRQKKHYLIIYDDGSYEGKELQADATSLGQVFSILKENGYDRERVRTIHIDNEWKDTEIDQEGVP